MTKYVLLKQKSSTTYDLGFRCNGYEVLEIVESEEGPNPILDDELLTKVLNEEFPPTPKKKGKK